MNCMCPKPTYLSFYQSCAPQVKLRPPYDEEILHGKKADRQCERCGRGLCGDCGIPTGTYTYIPIITRRPTVNIFRSASGEFFELIDEVICQACKEDLK